MTEEQEPTADLVDPEKPLALMDLGDAMLETKQLSSLPVYPDCYFVWGAKFGC
ncbi:hypothetical protein GCM10011487_11990 [Steroidobacter agaridevorans]|uniref:Uncharacterized protein n=1 Tax=Steroidobacter agaridevorans TaxID=2695856 RepID=A0A829Y7H9_9GAMM|nr:MULTISPECIES: hypothetical protein [Steroidobacteraceae]GFE79199.1 hypothetical protein GCM10011487_11990 [Steroidobacter agaridevorans]